MFVFKNISRINPRLRFYKRKYIYMLISKSDKIFLSLNGKNLKLMLSRIKNSAVAGDPFHLRAWFRIENQSLLVFINMKFKLLLVFNQVGLLSVAGVWYWACAINNYFSHVLTLHMGYKRGSDARSYNYLSFNKRKWHNSNIKNAPKIKGKHHKNYLYTFTIATEHGIFTNVFLIMWQYVNNRSQAIFLEVKYKL